MSATYKVISYKLVHTFKVAGITHSPVVSSSTRCNIIRFIKCFLKVTGTTCPLVFTGGLWSKESSEVKNKRSLRSKKESDLTPANPYNLASQFHCWKQDLGGRIDISDGWVFLKETFNCKYTQNLDSTTSPQYWSLNSDFPNCGRIFARLWPSWREVLGEDYRAT